MTHFFIPYSQLKYFQLTNHLTTSQRSNLDRDTMLRVIKEWIPEKLLDELCTLKVITSNDDDVVTSSCHWNG